MHLLYSLLTTYLAVLRVHLFESANRVKVSIVHFHLLVAYPYLFPFPWFLYLYSISKRALTRMDTIDERSGMCRVVQCDHGIRIEANRKKYCLRFFLSFHLYYWFFSPLNNSVVMKQCIYIIEKKIIAVCFLSITNIIVPGLHKSYVKKLKWYLVILW